MTEDKEYKDLLSRRLEGAYDAVYPTDEVPSAEDILRWQNMAEAKAGERKVRIRRLSTLAAVFLVSLALGVAIMVEPPKAEAGGDGKLEISYIDEQEEHFAVEKYKDVESVPDDIKEQYIMFDELPEGMEIEQIQIITAGQSKSVEIILRKCEKQIIINQYKLSGNLSKQTMFQETAKEQWGSKTVYINKYENEGKICYLLEHEGKVINIVTDNGCSKEEIQDFCSFIVK